MTGFDAMWLDLREAADQAARDGKLLAALAAWSEGRRTLGIADLGCGTGAVFRALSPRLPPAQDWVLIDADPALLEEAGARLTAMAAVGGYGIDENVRALTLCRDGVRRSIRLHEADISRDPAAIPIPERGLVTCNAFLDLVGAAWLERLVAAVAAARAAFYASLEVDGRIALDPVDPGDEAVLAAFRADQGRDKGFGRALGPEAPGRAAGLLREAGYGVRFGKSDWRLDADRRELLQAWLEGVARGARNGASESPVETRDWLDRRLHQARAGRLDVEVGHTDILALPPEAD